MENPDLPRDLNPPSDPNLPVLDQRDQPGPLVKIAMLYPMTRDQTWINGASRTALLATVQEAYARARRTVNRISHALCIPIIMYC